MANVIVKYFGVIKQITGMASERIDAENLGGLMGKIGNRYKETQYYLNERKSTDSSLVVLYNGQSVGNIKDYKRKLNDGDKIVLMTVIGGG